MYAKVKRDSPKKKLIVMDLNNISQDEFEKIEAYLNQKLSKEDLVIFKNRLTKEKGFKTKVNDIKTVLIGLETQALKEELDLFHKDIDHGKTESDTTESKVHSFNWKRLLVAAVLIIAAGSFWFLKDNSNERLYADYFTPDPGLPTTMSNNDNYEFYEAMVNYKQGDYKTAISKWEVLQKTKPNNDTLNYFIGVANMANKNETNAISFLENVTKNSEFTLVNDAYYYLGLAYLKVNKVDEAKANLLKSNTENSKALLSELNN